MSSLEEIGSLLGLIAFVGLAVLVFLTFQQARHLRRLRDWAGRAPERAAAAAAAAAEQQENGSEEPVDDEVAPEQGDEALAALQGPGRFDGVKRRLSDSWAELDRRMPVEPKLLFGGLAAIILGVGIATSGFGLLGDDSSNNGQNANREAGKGGNKKKSSNKGGGGGNDDGAVEVAVLNGTAPPGGVGVPGVADRVSGDVEAAGFKVGTVTDAPSTTASVVMYSAGADDDALELAEALTPLLGTTTTTEMTAEIESVAGGATLVLIVGQDDSTI